MVADALKGYIQLANGLTDVTRERASAAARSLVAQSPDLLGTAASTATSTAVSAAAQVQGFAEDLLVTSRDNRALLVGLIRTEVERVVAALGFAKEAEVDAVRHKVDRLEEVVEHRESTPSLRAALTPTKKAPAKRPAAKKAPVKVTAKKAPAKKAPAKVTAKKAPAKKAPVKVTAKKAPAKKAPAKVTAKKTPAKGPAAKRAPVKTPATRAPVTEAPQQRVTVDEGTPVRPVTAPVPNLTPAPAAGLASAAPVSEPPAVLAPAAPEVVTPEVVTPEVVTPEVVTPEVVTPEVVTPEVVDLTRSQPTHDGAQA